MKKLTATIIVIAGLAIGWLFYVRPEPTFGGADSKLVQDYNKSPQISQKYQLENATFKMTVKDDPKDKVVAKIGGDASFEPKLKIERWDEVNYSVKLIDNESGNPMVSFKDDKIVWERGNAKVNFYDLPDGYEFEVTLKERPADNKIEFSLETKGLKFSYQSPFTERYQNGYSEKWKREIIVSESEVKDLTGTVLEGARSEDVVGSYAVYASEPKTNLVGGKTYKTGKVGQIYRPKIVDANGNEFWGKFNKDLNKTHILSISLPEGMAYPIVIDPTFGNNTDGDNFTTLCEKQSTNFVSVREGSALQASVTGNLVDLNAQVSTDMAAAIDGVTTLYINQKDSGGSGTHALIGSGEATFSYPTPRTTGVWKQISGLSIAVNSGTTYIPNISANCENIIATKSLYIFFDSSSGQSAYYDEFINASAATAYANSKESPWTKAVTDTDKIYSIYGTYYQAPAAADPLIRIEEE